MKTRSPPKTATGACLCDIMDIMALPDALGTHTGGTISQLRAPPLPPPEAEGDTWHSQLQYLCADGTCDPKATDIFNTLPRW